MKLKLMALTALAVALASGAAYAQGRPAFAGPPVVAPPVVTPPVAAPPTARGPAFGAGISQTARETHDGVAVRDTARANRRAVEHANDAALEHANENAGLSEPAEEDPPA